MVQWLRLHAPNVGGPGPTFGQGTRFHMLQLRVCMPQLKKKNSSVERKTQSKIPAVTSKQPKQRKINIKKRKVLSLINKTHVRQTKDIYAHLWSICGAQSLSLQPLVMFKSFMLPMRKLQSPNLVTMEGWLPIRKPCLLIIHCVTCATLQILSHLILKTTLWGKM